MFSRKASTVASLSVLALCGALAQPARAQTESFDGVPGPGLPAGWTTSSVSFLPMPWEVEAYNPRSGPNALVLRVYLDDATSEATSPAYTVPASGRLRLRFYKSHWFETGRDGLRLQMSVDGGAFTEIVSAGGAFVTGGYTLRPDGASYGFWTAGAPFAYSETIAETPTLTPGQQVRFRWEAFFDSSVASGDVFVDDVEVTAAAPAPPPPPPVIPTMTEWAMILLGTILAGGTALHLNRRRAPGA